MIEGRPFLYQAIQGTVYHVAEKGVNVVQSWSSDESIAAFVDGDQADCQPKDILLQSSMQIIMASSPEGVVPNQEWMKQLGCNSVITTLATRLWSPSELFLTGLVLAFLSTT